MIRWKLFDVFLISPYLYFAVDIWLLQNFCGCGRFMNTTRLSTLSSVTPDVVTSSSSAMKKKRKKQWIDWRQSHKRKYYQIVHFINYSCILMPKIAKKKCKRTEQITGIRSHIFFLIVFLCDKKRTIAEPNQIQMNNEWKHKIDIPKPNRFKHMTGIYVINLISARNCNYF